MFRRSTASWASIVLQARREGGGADVTGALATLAPHPQVP